MRAMGRPRPAQGGDTRRAPHWLTDFFADLRFALRSLRRTPGLAALVVVTLAVGIGMTATPFSMLDALIFRPYPVPDPHAIVTLMSTSRDDPYELLSYREYRDIRDQTVSYDGVVANNTPSAVGFAAWSRETPHICGAMLVSGNYASWRLEPSLGAVSATTRTRSAAATPWWCLAGLLKNEPAGDPVSSVASSLNGGVHRRRRRPESFPGCRSSAPRLTCRWRWRCCSRPIRRKRFFEDRDDRELIVRGRLAPGATPAVARAELAALAKDFRASTRSFIRPRAAVRTQFEIGTRGDDVNWKFGVVFRACPGDRCWWRAPTPPASC
jgi:hypothetical protein